MSKLLLVTLSFSLFFSAISVLLGEAWKSLPMEEREAYSNKAKVLADEQKKIHPDCWKRKKTVANSSNPGDVKPGGGPIVPPVGVVPSAAPGGLPLPLPPPDQVINAAQRVDQTDIVVKHEPL